MMPDIPPYLFLDPETGEVKGVDVDIVRAAAARLGRDLAIRVAPFAEILPSVKNGTADFAAAAITITEGRSRDADFSDSYAEEGCVFLYRAGDPPPTMIRAESLRVGVVESMFGDFYLTRHGIEPYRFGALPELVEALSDGRLDAVFYDRPALLAAVEASGGALAVTPLETREHYGIAVRKGRPDLLEAVNAVIRERKEGGAP
jgi:polar amino acid transport system substrate-binding protein